MRPASTSSNHKLADELEAAEVEDLLGSDLLDRVTAALRASPDETDGAPDVNDVFRAGVTQAKYRRYYYEALLRVLNSDRMLSHDIARAAVDGSPEHSPLEPSYKSQLPPTSLRLPMPPVKPPREPDLTCDGFVPDPHSSFCDKCGYPEREHRRTVKASAPLDREAVNALALQCAQASAVVRNREWNFDRYRNGKLKAQGVTVHAATEAEAWEKARSLLHIDGNMPTDELRLQPLNGNGL